MALYIASLNSGSNGNCYYIGNEHDAVFIDAGISCRETERRMKRLGLNISKVKAVFISHEHTDHIRGVTVLSKKYRLPVYITPLTRQCGRLELDEQLINPFTSGRPVDVGNLTVTAFSKPHDASEPHSFTVSYKGITVGIFTDIGQPCESLATHFSQCHAAFLEANYDEEMLEKGRYPYYLKRRIRGGSGHLSNAQALELFTAYKSPNLSHLFLSHLSKENNCPVLAGELFKKYAGETEIIVASRYEESQVYYIGGKEEKVSNGAQGKQAVLF